MIRCVFYALFNDSQGKPIWQPILPFLIAVLPTYISALDVTIFCNGNTFFETVRDEPTSQIENLDHTGLGFIVFLEWYVVCIQTRYFHCIVVPVWRPLKNYSITSSSACLRIQKKPSLNLYLDPRFTTFFSRIYHLRNLGKYTFLYTLKKLSNFATRV